MVLQAVFPEHPAVLVAVQAREDGAALWLWDRNGPRRNWEFPTPGDAQRWAEREFAIRASAWIESADTGSPRTLLDVLRTLRPRPFTCDEMCAAVCLAYLYVAIDERGLPLFPTPERCMTSYNVVSELPDTLDWTRSGCTLFEARAANGYGFVADVHHHARTVEASREFREIKAAITSAARISAWVRADYGPAVWPVRAPADSGPLAPVVNIVIEHRDNAPDTVMSGYEAEAFGIASGLHLLDSKSVGEQLRDRPYLGRAAEVVAVNGTIHLVFSVIRETSESVFTCDMYVTSAEGRLRKAARRIESDAILDVPLADAADAFENETHAWLEWAARRLAPSGPRLVRDTELERMLAEIDSLDENSEAVLAFAATLQRRGIFVAEHMAGAPPHVVKRTLIAALRRLTGLKTEE